MTPLPTRPGPPTPSSEAALLLEAAHGRVLLALRLAVRNDPLAPAEQALLADHLFAIEATVEGLAVALGRPLPKP